MPKHSKTKLQTRKAVLLRHAPKRFDTIEVEDLDEEIEDLASLADVVDDEQRPTKKTKTLEAAHSRHPKPDERFVLSAG